MTAASSTGRGLATVSSRAVATPYPLNGREVAGVAEALYRRLFTLAVGGLQLTCALAVLAAVVRTDHANFVRTAALALTLTLLAALALRYSDGCYRAIRRRPAVALTGPILALCALAIDAVSHSPLSLAAVASIALPAFVCGRRWALAAATVISVGAVAAASLHIGWGALNSVGQGAVGYFIWAVVLAGLAESVARLAMRMPLRVASPAMAPPPLVVTNLAGDPPPPLPTPAAPSGDPEPRRAATIARLTARQLQVLALLAHGLRAEDIAGQLGIATTTVYKYVKQAKDRAGANTRDELVALAVLEGLVSTGPPVERRRDDTEPRRGDTAPQPDS